MDPSWTKEAIDAQNVRNQKGRARMLGMREMYKVRDKFIPTGKVGEGQKPMKPAKPIVDLKGVSSSGAKGASRQQSILTKKATSATPANIWRGMIPMLAKGMGALGSLLLDPKVTATDAQEKKHMSQAGNFPNPADDSTSDMMRSMGRGGY